MAASSDTVEHEVVWLVRTTAERLSRYSQLCVVQGLVKHVLVNLLWNFVKICATSMTVKGRNAKFPVCLDRMFFGHRKLTAVFLCSIVSCFYAVPPNIF